MRHAKEYERGCKVKAALFFLTLFAALTVSLIGPLHPKESSQEGRKLARFPEFSVEALLDGEYFEGIDLWFSDTFPGRDMFLGFNKRLRELYGLQTVQVHGEVKQGDEIPDKLFTGN